MFHLTCFNVEGAHDPTFGLISGQLSISGNLFRRQVYTSVIDQFSNYPKSNSLKSNSLYTLAANEHSKQRVECCAVRVGEEEFGFDGYPYFSKATSHDQVLVRLLANFPPVLCAELFAMLSKISQSPSDSSFVATLYTSGNMRYTDEDEILEMCKWTVDLVSWPTFQ
ncbi:hypothetical protein H1R20_g4511, partial [Candolleomyces eurysporus]